MVQAEILDFLEEHWLNKFTAKQIKSAFEDYNERTVMKGLSRLARREEIIVSFETLVFKNQWGKVQKRPLGLAIYQYKGDDNDG